MKDQNKVIVRRADGSRRVYTRNDEPSMTQQQFKDECDVNNIMAKYRKTGELYHLARKQGVFADVSQITDYQTMLNQVHDAKAAFGALPSHLRRRFENDPGQLLEFLRNPNNRDEAIELGLIDKPKTVENAINDDQTTTNANTTKVKKASQTSQKPSTPQNEE